MRGEKLFSYDAYGNPADIYEYAYKTNPATMTTDSDHSDVLEIVVVGDDADIVVAEVSLVFLLRFAIFQRPLGSASSSPVARCAASTTGMDP